MATTEQLRLADMPWEEGTADDAGGNGRPPRRARRTQPPPRRPSFLAGVIGVIGELMITVGVLLGLFVVWQLYWTDHEAGIIQRQVIEEFEELDDFIAAPEEVAIERYDEPPVPSRVGDGETFGTLHVPRWGSDYRTAIAEGIGQSNVLDRGYVGHYPSTQYPGELGNFALAGHRQSYGAPFHNVQDLQVGDAIIVETSNAYLVYYVTSDEIVLPDQTEVLYPVPHEPGVEATESIITFTTCHPLFSTRERWITYGEYSHWVHKDDGRPVELIEGSD